MLIPTASSFAALAAAEGAKMPLIPHPEELIFGFIMFLILFGVIKAKVSPALEKVYAERRSQIEGGIEQAQEVQAQAEATKEQYEALLLDARTEAAQIREQARTDGAAIVDELRTKAQAEADRIVEAAHKQTLAERAAAATSLRSEVGGMSTALASKIVGESLDDSARQSGIIDRFLAELESGKVTAEKVR